MKPHPMSQKFHHFLAFLFLLSLQALPATHAVVYSIIDTAVSSGGGLRYEKDIGLKYSWKTLNRSTTFIWRIFQQKDPSDRKAVDRVTLFIENMGGVAYTTGDEIHVSADYLGNYTGDVRREFTGVMYHEMTHVWQWNGRGATPGGLIEGIADFVRLKADLPPSHWVKPGEGDRWDEGYDVTAWFLDYCDGLRKGFVWKLNKKMRSGYNQTYFVDLLGKPVDQLWKDYKAKYGK